MTTPKELAKQLLGIIHKDKDRLKRIDDYLHGRQDGPYMPDTSDAEYKLLSTRAVSNWMPLLVGTPAQALYLDGFRSGTAGDKPDPGKDKATPEWDHFQHSRLDARQQAIYRGALTFGHSFTVTEMVKGKVITKGMSALKTSALFEDPANDDTPYAALTVTKWSKEEQHGEALMWDGTRKYLVGFKSLSDVESVTIQDQGVHGATTCPVTRFAASVDLEGRTTGVVEPMIPLQNRINQTVFDLLVAQTYGSFKVRTATGMAPPIKRDQEGDPVLDDDGQPQPLPINVNVKRFLFAEDPDVKFGSLDETPLGGYIDSIDMSIRHLAAISQTPPHHLLGQIANLSAEALQAAETALSRKIAEFRAAFGESWERVFRLAAELEGNTESAEDFAGEAIWRDMEARSMAQVADALGKLRQNLEVPKKGLWAMVPGVTQTQLEEWYQMEEDDDPVGTLSTAVQRSLPDARPDRVESGPPVVSPPRRLAG